MGTYPPRECGIATFTKDLATAIQNNFSPDVKSKIVALNNDITNIYNYPEEVLYEMDETNIGDYIDIAKKINETDAVKSVSIQHEFGIFGGEYGSYLIPFLETLNKPVVTTMHTLLPNPDDKMKRIVQLIAKRSNCLVVMNNTAVDILRKDYELKDERIAVIPHGIPSVPFKTSLEDKEDLGYADRIVLSSFGMMSRGKGYGEVIRALPKVIEQYPNVVYLIVGETHPVVRKIEGETYRNSLEKLVCDLNLKKNVKFYNKYVKAGEIIKYLQATDIYISSSINPNQIVSGTLAYAMGCGRAVVSTPFLHAREVVTRDRGVLAEFNNPDSFADAIIRILSNPKLKEKMERNAYVYARNMTWSNVALAYMDIFKNNLDTTRHETLKKVKLDQMIKLTDGYGIIQFADGVKPDRQYGYSLDDNARALIICCMEYPKAGESGLLNHAETYLKYIGRVLKDGKFYNFADENMNIDWNSFSEDAHSRAIWALGYLTASQEMPEKLKGKARELFMKGLPQALKIRSTRATAYNIKGLCCYNKAHPSDLNIDMIHRLADHLVSLYNDNRSDDWQWFEPYLTYANARIPESLYLAYQLRKRDKYLDVAEASLNFLLALTVKEGMFHPIGHNGWYIKNGKRAYFDQQPIEASSMVQALTTAYETTGKKNYRSKAHLVFSWFHGNNHLNQIIYDEKTGGCHDGLGNQTINQNQGAESTISYLLAR